MKSTFWKLVLAVAVATFGTAPAMGQYCTVHFSMTNAARHVIGEVNTECPPSWHSTTWDNWGVSSNFCGEWNGDQFRGFHLSGSGQGHWNSCTRDHIRDTDLVYYNHDHNGNLWGDDQWQDGEYSYCNTAADIQVDCPMDTDWDTTCDTGGCLALNSRGFDVYNQFLSLYGLDWEGDEFITTLYVDPWCCHANMSCTVGYCSGPVYSAWYPTTWSTNTPVEANVRMRVDYATFTDWAGNCIWLKNIDPRYDCYY